MSTLNRRERIMVIGCVIFLIAVGFMLLLPSGKQGTSAQKLLSADQAQAQLRANKAKYVRLGNDQDRITATVQKLSYDQPAENLVPQMVKDLQEIAAHADVHLREVRPLRAHKLKSGLAVGVPVEVRFRAPFQPDVVRFLYYVEEPARKMVVDKVDINSADPQLRSVDVAAQISVFTQSTSGVTTTGEGEVNDVSQSTGQG